MEEKEVNEVIEKLRTIDLSKAAHQLVTIPGTWLAVIFLAGWIGKPWLADAVGFIPRAEADKQHKELIDAGDLRDRAILDIGSKVDDLALEVRVNVAFQMVSTLEEKLASHQAEDQNTPGWRDEGRRLKARVTLARQYKDCLVNKRPNCHLLQRQLWQ